MVNTIAKELVIRSKDWKSETFETIYFGGGTPSLLNVDELRLILDTCQENYQLSNELEITLECNPDDCSDEGLSEWKKMGSNRLSIGMHALQNEQLNSM